MTRMILLAGTALSLAGCAQTQVGGSLVFGRTQTVGVSVAGSVPDQGAHLTLGFSDRNIAVVPTTTAAGESIRSVTPVATGGQVQDALSVLGQFEVDANAGNVTTGLGTFFSTGTASSKLAEGFRARLGGAPAPAPTPTPTPTPTPAGGGN